MTSTQAPRPRNARRDRIRLIVAGTAVVLAGAGVLAGCASLGPALAQPVVTQTVSGPLPVIQSEVAPAVETAELPAEGVVAPALPDYSSSIPAQAIAEAAPVVQAAPAEAAPVESSDEIDVEYAGESAPTAAESAEASQAADPAIHSAWYTTYGSQAELDACTGDLVYQPYGASVAVAAIHNYCGGDSIPKEAGYLVSIDGVVYRSLGVAAVLSQSQHTSLDIPAVGDLQIQTCWPNAESMAFIAFELA
ncbi:MULTISPECIES: hypothetical protein [unclassified Pseudoclavibacter]|uniref:hypothetical protein n=1 Tax=unclassified Pseudoclavibacter TaxID=2615177 RepID=UPI001BA8CBDB|nr:hypothetical protein [Pseudoclavibacter sp. Marseille-Q4354]MBS3180035.1 hypothetical protein [Pseudoclavibacter sp. Marseille-Q4354]